MHSHCEVLLHETAVPEQTSPQLHSNDAKDEEDKEAKKQNIPQHGQGVQEQIHQDPHACRWERGRGGGGKEREKQKERK